MRFRLEERRDRWSEKMQASEVACGSFAQLPAPVFLTETRCGETIPGNLRGMLLNLRPIGVCFRLFIQSDDLCCEPSGTGYEENSDFPCMQYCAYPGLF